MVQEIACNKAYLDFVGGGGWGDRNDPYLLLSCKNNDNNKLESWHTALDRNGAHKQDQR